MRIICAIGRLLSGFIAITSGLVTLFCNDITIAFFNNTSALIQRLCIILLISLGTFLIIASIVDFISILRKDRKRHCLTYQSKRFINFFSKWYSRPGKLSIICDDLDWIKNNNDNRIFNELLKKSEAGSLNIFIATNFNSKNVTALKSAGARVYSAPKRIVDSFTFSCLSVMGNSAGRAIVRNKQGDKGGTVIFEEICNTYITELLNNLLADWSGESDYKLSRVNRD